MGSLSFSAKEIREVRRFCDLLEAVKMAGEPRIGSTSILLNEAKAHRRESKAPADAPRGPNWRKLYDKYRRRLNRLSDELEVEIKGDRLGPRGWQCPGCGRFQRVTARFCDRCGRHRDDRDEGPCQNGAEGRQ